MRCRLMVLLRSCKFLLVVLQLTLEHAKLKRKILRWIVFLLWWTIIHGACRWRLEFGAIESLGKGAVGISVMVTFV